MRRQVARCWNFFPIYKPHQIASNIYFNSWLFFPWLLINWRRLSQQIYKQNQKFNLHFQVAIIFSRGISNWFIIWIMDEKSPKIRQKRELISAKQAGKISAKEKFEQLFMSFTRRFFFGIERTRNCFVLMKFEARWLQLAPSNGWLN